MHPTPDEQLTAALRLLDDIGARIDDPDTRAVLGDVTRLLRRLGRTWAARLPFLLDDTARATRLLVELRPYLPSLAARIDAAANEPPARSEPAAHDANLVCRELLAAAVAELPDGPEGEAARGRIATHLREGLGAQLRPGPGPRR